MNRVLKILILFFISCTPLFIFNSYITANSVTLTGSVEKVPDTFYGTWRVVSKLESTNSAQTFKQMGLDLWNLSLSNNVIKLNNPFSGAEAEISISKCEGNNIEFTKIGSYGKNKLTDVVNIKILQDSFSGYNIIKMESQDGEIKTAKYTLKGEKIAGMSILGD